MFRCSTRRYLLLLLLGGVRVLDLMEPRRTRSGRLRSVGLTSCLGELLLDVRRCAVRTV